MRLALLPLLSAAAVILLSVTPQAYAQADSAHAIEGGGISVPGWTASFDAGKSESQSAVKLTKEGDELHVVTGPAAAFWSKENQASGDYTVKGTFTEPKYMNLNTHPHPYGVFIGGSEMGTPQQSYLYCAAYGSGNFIVRGFGPEPFQMNGRHGEENAAVHKAAGPGQPVTQEIAVSVKGGKVECSINGTTVASYDKASVATAGKLKSTDGIYGIRSAHNTDVTVSGFGVAKN